MTLNRMSVQMSRTIRMNRTIISGVYFLKECVNHEFIIVILKLFCCVFINPQSDVRVNLTLTHGVLINTMN